MLDEDGSAIVVHENADNRMTQPIGGAGGRIACGVIDSHLSSTSNPCPRMVIVAAQFGAGGVQL